MRQRIVRALAVSGFIVALGAAALAAAGRQTDRSPDVLNALLVEVRGLRAAMEQMASAGPRIELALGRLQLQEQRVNNLLRRQLDVRERLAGAEREADNVASEIEQQQELLSRTSLDEQDRLSIQQQLKQMKQRIPLMQGDVQRLRAEEAEVAQLVATEQNRWTEINQQLEALERALARR
jgi:hypothetical protein